MAPFSLDMTWAGIGVDIETSMLPHFTRFNKGAHGHPRIFVRAAEAAAAGGGGGGALMSRRRMSYMTSLLYMMTTRTTLKTLFQRRPSIISK